MNIKVIGIGCSNCNKLEANVKEAVKQSLVDADVEKISDPKKFMLYGIMKTPGLVIDGKVASAGRIPTVDEIIAMIKAV